MILAFLPSFLLSGFVYAIANMPLPVQIATHAFPARHFTALLKGIYLKAVGLETLGVEAALRRLVGFHHPEAPSCAAAVHSLLAAGRVLPARKQAPCGAGPQGAWKKCVLDFARR